MQNLKYRELAKLLITYRFFLTPGIDCLKFGQSVAKNNQLPRDSFIFRRPAYEEWWPGPADSLDVPKNEVLGGDLRIYVKPENPSAGMCCWQENNFFFHF